MRVEIPEIRKLRGLAESERLEALEVLVVAEFKATLLMSEDEDLPAEESFFELGLTSLRLTEIKQRLELALGCEISTNALFNQPTVTALLSFLTQGPLAPLFPPRETERPRPEAADAPGTELVDEILSELYDSTRTE